MGMEFKGLNGSAADPILVTIVAKSSSMSGMQARSAL